MERLLKTSIIIYVLLDIIVPIHQSGLGLKRYGKTKSNEGMQERISYITKEIARKNNSLGRNTGPIGICRKKTAVCGRHRGLWHRKPQ